MSDIDDTTTGTEIVVPTIEDKARGMGWRPANEYEGDETQWVDAKEFVGRKPLFDKIHDQSKKLSDVEKTLKATAEHIKKVEEIAYKRAVSELKKERDAAFKASDVAAVLQLDTEISELKESAKQDTDNSPPPEYLAWAEKNPWFNTDTELYDFSCAVYDAHMKKHPNDTNLSDVLDKVEKATKRAYPEKFGIKPLAMSTVEGGSKPSGAKTAPGYNSLNADQKRVCDTFVRSGVMTKDAYVKSLIEIGEL